MRQEKDERSTEEKFCAEIDIVERDIYDIYGAEVLDTLLCDRTREYWARKHPDAPACAKPYHIIWAIDDYAANGEGFAANDQIIAEKLIADEHKTLLQPRVVKPAKIQRERTQKKAEVFTPAWVCNAQNNLVDETWFGRKEVFNHENNDHTWTTTTEKITFPEGKTWQDFVLSNRLEITCGEAPYLASRYDAASGGAIIPVVNRIGILDRKLRIVSENCDGYEDWIEWSIKAVQSTYGFEWQGDNLILARESLLITWIENHRHKFSRDSRVEDVRKVAEVLSWNIWQMDGLKFVLPNTCHEEVETDMFGEVVARRPCPGCKGKWHIAKDHNGVACVLKDWKTGEIVEFRSLLHVEDKKEKKEKPRGKKKNGKR